MEVFGKERKHVDFASVTGAATKGELGIRRGKSNGDFMAISTRCVNHLHAVSRDRSSLCQGTAERHGLRFWAR